METRVVIGFKGGEWNSLGEYYQVRQLHAAALAAGGSDEGAPGFRADDGANFYVGYLRDPQGNKIALYSSNPNDPTRDG